MLVVRREVEGGGDLQSHPEAQLIQGPLPRKLWRRERDGFLLLANPLMTSRFPTSLMLEAALLLRGTPV